MNKLKYILIFLLIVAAAATAYFFFYQKSKTVTLTTTKEPKLTKILDEPAISPVVTFDGSGYWYFNSKGQMFRRSFTDDKITEHAFSSLLSLTKAIWSPKDENFIAVTNDSLNFFDNKTNSYTALPKNIQSFDWMPDGSRIVYIWKGGDNKTQSITLANADASGFTKIKDVFWPDLTVKVSPDGKNALLVRSNIQDVNQVYKVDLQTGNFETVIDAGRNIDVKWVSPTEFLYNQTINTQYNIKLYDFATRQSTDLALSTTLDKIVVDNTGKNIYAAATDRGNEALWKINLESLLKQKIYDFDASVMPSKLILNGQNILIVNGPDNKLYYFEH
jgi:hypothetical protein